jgi:hypothetical protein
MHFYQFHILEKVKGNSFIGYYFMLGSSRSILSHLTLTTTMLYRDHYTNFSAEEIRLNFNLFMVTPFVIDRL